MIEDNLAIMESMGVDAPEKLVDTDFFNRMWPRFLALFYQL